MEKQLLHESRTELKLRPYQDECLDAIASCIKQNKFRLLVNLPVGSGKTVIFASLIKKMNYPRTLIFVHTEELMQQAKEKVKMICPGATVGTVNSTNKEFEATIVISSIQAAYFPSNLEKLKAQGFELIILDECHRSAASATRKVLNKLGFGKGTTRPLIGFTGTPIRTDGLGLAEVFETPAYEKPTIEMINAGWLVKPVCYKIKTDLDLSDVKTIDGDLGTTSLAALMNVPEMNQLIVNTYIEKANGRQTICFAVDVKHAKALAEEFQKQGICAQAVYGEMPSVERQDIINRYKAGDVTVLTNCAVLSTGFDSPETSCVILARPTKSVVLYTQCIGRGLRKAPWANKTDCIVLDYGDKNHKLVSSSVLYHDTNVNKQAPKGPNEQSERNDIPSILDHELRSALINFDPINGDTWLWEKENKTHILRGAEGYIMINPDGKKYKVIYSNEVRSHTIAKQVEFEFAFGMAEQFANDNKHLFVINDMKAEWRKKPISPRQKTLFEKRGFKEGIPLLTSGQADILIRSGVLNRK